MKYRALLTAAILGGLLTPIAASAAVTAVEVRNTSNACAWMTIYASHPGLPWAIAAPAFSLRAGQSYLVSLTSGRWSEVKARAEVKKNADCSGANIADVEDYRKGISIAGDHRLGARIWDDAHGYHITF